jgi:hypothetical protein
VTWRETRLHSHGEVSHANNQGEGTPPQSARMNLDGSLAGEDSNRALNGSDDCWDPEPSSIDRSSNCVSDCEPCPLGFCLKRIQMSGLRLRSKVNRSSDKSRVSAIPAVTVYGYQTRYQSRTVECSCVLRRNSRVWGSSMEGGCRFQSVSLDCR